MKLLITKLKIVIQNKINRLILLLIFILLLMSIAAAPSFIYKILLLEKNPFGLIKHAFNEYYYESVHISFAIFLLSVIYYKLQRKNNILIRVINYFFDSNFYYVFLIFCLYITLTIGIMFSKTEVKIVGPPALPYPAEFIYNNTNKIQYIYEQFEKKLDDLTLTQKTTRSDEIVSLNAGTEILSLGQISGNINKESEIINKYESKELYILKSIRVINYLDSIGVLYKIDGGRAFFRDWWYDNRSGMKKYFHQVIDAEYIKNDAWVSILGYPIINKKNDTIEIKYDFGESVFICEISVDEIDKDYLKIMNSDNIINICTFGKIMFSEMVEKKEKYLFNCYSVFR